MIDSLLALCARAEGNPAQRSQLLTKAANYNDWDSFADRAESQGMAPLALLHLQEASISIPEDARRSLQALALRHRRANHIRARVLAEILTTFEAEDIDALVLKGAALANSVYPTPGLRPMRDMDLMVREGDVLRAQRRLLDLGFNTSVPESTDDLTIHHLPVAQREVDGLTVSVEVHLRLFPHAGGDLTYSDLNASAISFSSSAVTGRTLGHEEMLWHIYRHAMAKPLIAQPLRLIWMADFISLVERRLGQIDWDKIRDAYPQVWNILPLFHFISPWSSQVLEELQLPIEPRPQGAGIMFQGWPHSSVAEQRKKGMRGFLKDTFWPSEWWIRLYYGVGCQLPGWWWTRLVRHPLHIGHWVLEYLGKRVKS